LAQQSCLDYREGMDAPAPSLRSVLTRGTIFLAGTSILAAATVVVLTTLLHRASGAIESATHSVHLVVEMKLDLALQGQAETAIVKHDLAGSIDRRLLELESYVSTDYERQTLDEAKLRVRVYLRASLDPGRAEEEIAALYARAYSLLNELVTINIAQARDEATLSERIDYVSNIAGVALALLVLTSSAAFLYWVRGPLFSPILHLAGAMDRFGRGDLSSRTVVTGPRELREIGERFNEMAAQLERQRKHQRAFLAGVAHDLRDPVSSVLLSAEVARADPSLPAGHDVRRTLDRMTRQLRRLSGMINDFLDAAMIESGNFELHAELRDLGEVVRSTSEMFDGASSRHELILSVPSEPMLVRIDPLRVEQVISNLIRNAIKYSPDGGRVRVVLERRAGEILLAVIDEGLGMSPETKARLFEPFRRGLSREGIPGVGLGLWIVQRIVDAHRGRIEVESTLGEGSTVRVFFPTGTHEPGPGEAEKEPGNV
jgi:two-component system sensor histidine kinase MtrB